MAKYLINKTGIDKARRMIDARHYDNQTEWSEAAPDAKAENEQIEHHGWEGYGEWHLAVDTEASDETKDRYGFPFGDFSRVNRAALIHAKQRAAQNDHEEVARVAGELLDHLDSIRSG